MALKIYTEPSDWKRIKNEVQSSIGHYSLDFENISAILMLKAVNNVIASSRPFQKNVNDIKDFMPVVQRSVYFKEWRYKIKTTCNGIDGFTILRPNFQNGYEYVQITFEGEAQELKKSLKENDKLILVKIINQDVYQIFKVEESSSLFTEKDDFLALNELKSYDKTYFSEPTIEVHDTSTNLTPKQKIYFGSPGTGKSTAMQNFAQENGLEVIRTTFHPDTDYHSFVGGYKPIMKDDKITYQFIPQAFTKAYVRAYQHPEKNYLLAIEEINRGNCAQIFGDLFQCLDRNSKGYSCYPIDANADLANYLASQGLANSEQLILPPNLLIYATMNTSDQSLFPMDSAFKRRWDWEYVPIKFDENSSAINIVFDEETQYSWQSFIEKVNKEIQIVTKSEDKKIGVYFVSPANGKEISMEQFKNKVMFYLWSEIFKDEHESAESIFKYLNQDGNAIDFSFNELFENQSLDILKGFMNYLEIPTN